MSHELWRIATDTRTHQATDLSGRGAELSGGRCNRAGRPVVYTSTTRALACLETIVHLNAEGLPLNRILVRIEVPNDVWDQRIERKPNSLPVGWNAIPEGMASLDAGDAWLAGAASALLVVPSVVVPEECNVLINPQHPDAQRIKADKVRLWRYDARLA